MKPSTGNVVPILLGCLLGVVAAGALGQNAGPSSLTGKIAYNCGGDICLFDLGTGQDIQLTFTTRSDYNPKLSPDGTRIVFQSTAASAKSAAVYLMNADGTGQTLLSNFGDLPAWSPDGTRIAFSSKGIWVMEVATKSAHRITDHGIFPAWSPDGGQIAFTSNKTSGKDTELWVVNADGSLPHQVLSRSGADLDVVWSPAAEIAFAGYAGRKDSYEIFRFDPVNPSLVRLTISSKQDFEPAWSPDGSMMAFASLRVLAGIYVMNADGSEPRLIISGGRQPSWGP